MALYLCAFPTKVTLGERVPGNLRCVEGRLACLAALALHVVLTQTRLGLNLRLTLRRQSAGVRWVTARRGRPTLFRRLRSSNSERDWYVTPDKRSILGSDGWEWLVREFESRDIGALSRSLVFERPEVVRRVRDYPRDWAKLSDEQLYRLSLGT